MFRKSQVIMLFIIILLSLSIGLVGTYTIVKRNNTQNYAELNSNGTDTQLSVNNSSNSSVSKEQIDSSPTSIPESENKKKDYIIYDSNSKRLESINLKNFSIDDIRIARNEIYARHGYIFSDPYYKQYFDTKSWYAPKDKNVTLNDIELFNVTLLKNYEEKLMEEKYANNGEKIDNYEIKPKEKNNVKSSNQTTAYNGEIKCEDWSGIYFRNENDNGKLYGKDLKTGKITKLSDDIVSNLSKDTLIVEINKGIIYFINQSDNYSLYRINSDGSGRLKLYDDRILNITGFSDFIVYTRYTDRKRFRISFDGQERYLY